MAPLFRRSLVHSCKLCSKDLNKVRKSVNYPTTICFDCSHAERLRVRSNNKRKRNKRNPTGRIRVSEWMLVLAQHNYSCASCQRQGRQHLTMDHVRSLVNGGTNTVDNIQPLCVQCHESKDGHKRKPWWFLRRLLRKWRSFVWRTTGWSLPKITWLK